MANDTIGDSNTLQFDIPQKGNKDWSEIIKAAFKQIAEHSHEGNKTGKLLSSNALGTDSITTDKIANSNVTAEKIADNAITSNKLKDEADDANDVNRAVTTNHIKNANVTLAKLENVTSAKIIVGNGSNRPTSVDVSGDVSLANDGEITIGADKVTYSKMQNVATANTVLGSTSADGIVTETKVLTNMIQDYNVTTDKVADSSITVDKKKTYNLTLNGSAQDLTDLVTSADQAFKINYKIKDSGGTSVQIGTVTGQAGDYKVDEFVGTDRGAAFSYSTNQLQITGTNTDVLTYSIEFLE